MNESCRFQQAMADRLFSGRGGGNDTLPKAFFSFRYNGAEVDSGKLPVTVAADRSEAAFRFLELLYDIEPGVLRLRLTVKIYTGFPVIEYQPYFENYGAEPSGLVADFNALDLTFPLADPYYGEMTIRDWNHKACSRVRVRYHLGSCCQPSDFFPQEKILYPRRYANELELVTDDGRSSVSFMPFYSVDLSEECGFSVGVGWSGAWRMETSIPLAGHGTMPWGVECRTAVSMLNTNFRVRPGERLRQVGAFLQFRQEMGIRDAQNLHRRFMIAHHAPYDRHGKLIKPPVAFEVWGGLESAGIIERSKIIKDRNLPYDLCWIDAGWSGKDAPCPHFCEDTPLRSDWYERIGQWRINRYAHPDGLAPAADALRDAGMKVLLWFEPERICKASEGSVITEHPEWLLSSNADAGNLLLDLGNPDAREWITQIIIGYLKSEKIDHYRQDFNMNPLPFWTENDAPDRIGVHEMRHIEGLYLFWDALRREFPDLFIDNCASGGRRLDFILADYGYPLCQSDYATFGAYRSTCMQLENYFLDNIYPLHVGLSWLPEGDLYTALSCTGTGIGSKVWQFNGRFPDSGHDFDLHRKTLSLIARIRDYKITGDYYPLTQHAEELENWCAYQVHLPETGEGCVVYFRRRESPAATQSLRLHRIVPERTYHLEFSDGRNREFSGDALAGLTVELAKPRSVGIIFYRMKRDAK